MYYKLALLVLIGFFSVESQADRRPVGDLYCDRKTHESDCKLRWDFSQAPRAYVQVQRLDSDSGNWSPVGQPYESVRRKSNRVEGARLYRTIACDDPDVKRNCVSSRVQWAISRPAIDQIPEYLVDGDGVQMHISKDAPEDVQIAQYNVYRLIQLLDRIDDVSSLPPMTEPEVTDSALSPGGTSLSDDDQVLAGVYQNYRERRQRALSAVD